MNPSMALKTLRILLVGLAAIISFIMSYITTPCFSSALLIMQLNPAWLLDIKWKSRSMDFVEARGANSEWQSGINHRSSLIKQQSVMQMVHWGLHAQPPLKSEREVISLILMSSYLLEKFILLYLARLCFSPFYLCAWKFIKCSANA